MARDVGADAGHLYDDWSRLRARRSNGNGVIALLERDSSGSRAPPVALRLAVSESLAAEAGTGAGERAIVIGEDMEGRVIPKAKELGADYYDPPPADPSKWMANNRRWINEKMDEGCRIYDCGAAPGRANYPGATSPYYQMELDQIARRGYTNRVRLRGD